jgi:hypothetical protein
MIVHFRWFLLICAVFAGALGLTESAGAQCFSSQSVAAQTSTGEKTFTFQTGMHLCDGNGYTSGDINNAVVLIVREQREVLKSEKAENATVVYFELNYNYYNGSGTWAGFQPVILTVQDINHNNLLPAPIYEDNTHRAGCIYGHTIPYAYSGPLQDIFDQVAFVTFQVPRVTGVQHGC